MLEKEAQQPAQLNAKNPSIVVTAPGRVEVESKPIPVPGPNEILIKTKLSLISTGTEISRLEGKASGKEWQLLSDYPFVPGYSNVGVVIRVGKNDHESLVGSRVHSHGKHQCYTLSPIDRVTQVPDPLSDEEVPFTTLGKVAMNGLRRVGFTWGESVVVAGLGLLGQLICQLCCLAGARRIYVLEHSKFRKEGLPSDERIIILEGNLDSQIKQLKYHNRKRLADVVFEATGNPELIPQLPQFLRPQGRLAMISSPSGPSSFDFHDLCNRKSISIIGAHGFSHPPYENYSNPWTSWRHGELFLDYVREGLVSTSPLVSHRFDFSNAKQAYDLLLEHKEQTLGVILDWQ